MLEKSIKTLMVVILSAVALAVAGCAGAEVTKARLQLNPGAITRSDPILIKPVDASKTKFQGDFSDDPPSVAAGRKQLHDTFAQQAVANLRKEGLKALLYTPKTAATMPGAAVVNLDVKTFDAGSNAARFMVGFGAGASYMLTDVTITKGGKTIADFTIDANSGARGGFTALGSWLGRHIQDSVNILVNYLKKRVK